MTINLTRIYTRLGDDGQTHLGDMSRVAKTDARVEAYGDVDELNSQLGLLLALGQLPPRQVDWVKRIQNNLFDLGADLSVPLTDERSRLRIEPAATAWLEERCDEINAHLAPLKSFVIPGGSPASALLHVSRTVCRRAERRAVACGDTINVECVRYLNRLSDLLFILARASQEGGDELWQPGAGAGA